MIKAAPQVPALSTDVAGQPDSHSEEDKLGPHLTPDTRIASRGLGT